MQAGNASVHIPAYLPIPRWLSLLFGLPGIIAHGAALLRVLNDGQTVFPAKLVRGLPHKGIGAFAVVVFLPVHKRDGVQHKMVMYVFPVQMGGNHHLKPVSP